jgi:hypothetical protein
VTGTKTAKTTPCTVAGACENNDLRISEIRLTRRTTRGQDEIVAAFGMDPPLAG